MGSKRINTHSSSGTPKGYDLEELRGEFLRLYDELADKVGLHEQLVKVDTNLNTPQGYWAVKNVRAGKGGLAITARVVKALEIIVMAEGNKAKQLKPAV